MESVEAASARDRRRLGYYVRVLNELAEGDPTDRLALCRQITPVQESSEV